MAAAQRILVAAQSLRVQQQDHCAALMSTFAVIDGVGWMPQKSGARNTHDPAHGCIAESRVEVMIAMQQVSSKTTTPLRMPTMPEAVARQGCRSHLLACSLRPAINISIEVVSSAYMSDMHAHRICHTCRTA
jgi:hypothetical protein